VRVLIKRKLIYLELQSKRLERLAQSVSEKDKDFVAEPDFGILRDTAVFLVPH
jgi:hypothetical protein